MPLCFCTVTRTSRLVLITSLCVAHLTVAHAQYFSPVPNVLVNAQTANATDVNANFAALVAKGNTVFNDFEAEIAGLSSASTPPGMVLPFKLSVCPAGWLKSDGTSGTVDLRGRFARGTTVPPPVGTVLDDQFLSHTQAVSHSAAVITSMQASAIQTGSIGFAGNGTVTGTVLVGNPATGRFGPETRPKNVALLYCEKS